MQCIRVHSLRRRGDWLVCDSFFECTIQSRCLKVILRWFNPSTFHRQQADRTEKVEGSREPKDGISIRKPDEGGARFLSQLKAVVLSFHKIGPDFRSKPGGEENVEKDMVPQRLERVLE